MKTTAAAKTTTTTTTTMTTTAAATTTTTMTTTTTAATKGGGDVRFEDLGGEPQLKPSPPMGSTTMADPKQGRSGKDFGTL